MTRRQFLSFRRSDATWRPAHYSALIILQILVVLWLLVVDIDVQTDTSNHDEDGQELNPIVVHAIKKIATDENEGADNSADDSRIEFHCL